ncbi:putative eukaryotic translation initiation factor 5-1 [Gracilariopsis chorda]|uniref:Putative eukaryotic translation initiation factor 5-1 n=1 Tax=Gracilariopsis chorda TaxID=448386 RepID=A0A2V3IER6_9FLOR|nr:putative eukaryotic translation initiation factor 5-1 [Gracilariopsis chorda]|eukprot:PXF40579.1 putative eukaryotic translation initiation factor 5-1 [Gracilariopsis chorda]
MESVNIGGGDDQFNRYKMPPVIGKVEGRGNGIKTRIVNCVEVARALHRPPGYVCKFFGCELCAQTKINDADGEYIVNGAFSQSVLADTLQKFIKMFVLCNSCNLPETDIKVKKNGLITQVCNACGATGVCDMTHKLCTYIVNNPPDGKKKKVGAKKDKAARRAAKAAKKAQVDADEDDERAAKKAARRAAKKAAATAVDTSETLVMPGEMEFTEADFAAEEEDDDDVQWSVDTSKEAQEARQRELGAAASILERAPVEDEWNKVRKLRAYIDDGKKASKVIAKSEKLFGEEGTIQGIVKAAVLDEPLSSVVQSVGDRALSILVQLGKPMPVEAQEALLDYFQWAGTHDNRVVPTIPHILKLIYDDGVVEEEVIVSWFEKAELKEDVKKGVEVIVKWLQDAEEEESEEEESDEEER